MFEAFLNFLKKTRKADVETKKFWLIIMSAASISIIILIWIAVLNSYSIKSDKAGPIPPSHLAIFKNGLKAMSAEFYGVILPFLIPGRSLDIDAAGN